MNTSEVKVGAVTLGGAAILAGMISFLGAFNIFDSGYDVNVSYSNVQGLAVGNAVRYAGVPIGTVKETKVNPDNVMVTCHINKGIQIPAEADWSIGSDGVMGERFVDVKPPKRISGGYVDENATIAGSSSGSMEQFMSNSSELLEKMEQIVDALNNVFGDREVQRAMRDGFINAGEISRNMSELTGIMAKTAEMNQKDISTMISQLRETTEHINSLMRNMDADGKTGRNMAKIVAHLERTSRNVEDVTGLLSSVARDPQTKEDLQATLHNTREISDRAKNIMGGLASADTTLRADVLHSAKGGKWRANAGVRFDQKEAGTFSYLGASSIGEHTKLDLYFGKDIKGFEVSAGAMQGEFGIGLGYNFNDRLRVYSQLYDFNDSKLRVGGEYLLAKDIYVVGESLDLLHGSKRDVYLGVRTYF